MESFQEMADRITEKMAGSVKRSGVKIPYTTTVDGVYDDKFETAPYFWTNGFWPGIVWLMYQKTGDAYYKDVANRLEERLDGVLLGRIGEGVSTLHHDVGFMWLLSAVANYRLTGDKASRNRGLIAAYSLASRFSHKGGYIVAWNYKEHEGWSIIDTMMNIPLLCWATDETGYGRYRDIAIAHADKSLGNHLRSDGSCEHIVIYDVETGVKTGALFGQGYADGSSWTRGQSWGLYGYALAYAHTKEQRFLDAAKRIANYYIAAVTPYGFVPPVDFRAPLEPATTDTTSGGIASCGLIEIAKYVPENERQMYLSAAEKIIRAMYERHCDLSGNCDALLHGGSESYHNNRRGIDIIYGDYFFMEAVFRLAGMDINMW